jgi:GxxExxY protein
LESIYERCLIHELKLAGLNVISQKQSPVIYKGITMDFNYRIDLHAEQKAVIELKAVEEINNVHIAQMMTYLKLTENKVG